MDTEKIEIPKYIFSRKPRNLRFFRAVVGWSPFGPEASLCLVSIDEDRRLGLSCGDVFTFKRKRHLFLGTYLNFPRVEFGDNVVIYEKGAEDAMVVNCNEIRGKFSKIGHQDI